MPQHKVALLLQPIHSDVTVPAPVTVWTASVVLPVQDHLINIFNALTTNNLYCIHGMNYNIYIYTWDEQQ